MQSIFARHPPQIILAICNVLRRPSESGHGLVSRHNTIQLMESKAHLQKLTPMITNYLIPLICRLRHEVPIRLQSYIHTKLLEGSPLAKDVFLEEHTIEQSDLLFNSLHIKYMIV